MDNLEEMDKFLERRLNQEETENMNRPITSTKIEPTIQKLPNKSPWPDCFMGKFCQTFRQELTYSLQKLLPKKLQKKEYSQIYAMKPPSP